MSFDSFSSGSASFVSEDVHTVDSHAQTDISQFQIDEIVLRLAALQDKEILTTMLHVMTQSMETDPIPQKTMKDLGVNTQQHTYVSCGVATQPVYFKSQSIETDIHDFISRSIETDDARLLEKTEETQSKADHSQQTSLIIDRLQPAFDQEQQTSIIIDLPPRPSVDHVAVQSSPDVMEKMTAPMVALPWNYPMPASQEDMMNRSQQTSIELLNQLMARKLSVVSTSVGPDEEAESYHPGTDWNHLGSGSFYDGRMTDSIEMSTQCSPPMSRSVTTQNSRNLGVTNTRARSSSTSGLGTSIYEEENRQEVIIQTDDSYLKIARRLDEYRSNRTQFLPVVAASPLESRDIEPFKTDRPSERRGYSIEFKGLQRRCSIKPKRRMSHKIKKLFKSPSRHEKKDE
nr:CBN-TWK-31 protein [Haemonchus contortus]